LYKEAKMDTEIQYWLDTKNAYELNLKNGIGHRNSIIKLIEKINNKLETILI